MIFLIIGGLFIFAGALTLSLALCTMAGRADRDMMRPYRDRHNRLPRR